jgi:hypothetical protein
MAVRARRSAEYRTRPSEPSRATTIVIGYVVAH